MEGKEKRDKKREGNVKKMKGKVKKGKEREGRVR